MEQGDTVWPSWMGGQKCRSGFAWTENENKACLASYRRGKTIKWMANDHGRGELAILYKLMEQGVITKIPLDLPSFEKRRIEEREDRNQLSRRIFEEDRQVYRPSFPENRRELTRAGIRADMRSVEISFHQELQRLQDRLDRS